MRLEERPQGLVILELPVEQMGLLALGAALDEPAQRVLRALLAGQKVWVLESGLEYKRFKNTAPLGVFQKFVGLQRELREMGICVIRDRHW